MTDIPELLNRIRAAGGTVAITGRDLRVHWLTGNPPDNPTLLAEIQDRRNDLIAHFLGRGTVLVSPWV